MQINGEYWRPATSQTETPDGGKIAGNKVETQTDIFVSDSAQKIVINSEYWRPATSETETPDGDWKQHYAIWKRNLGRNSGD